MYCPELIKWEMRSSAKSCFENRQNTIKCFYNRMAGGKKSYFSYQHSIDQAVSPIFERPLLSQMFIRLK